MATPTLASSRRDSVLQPRMQRAGVGSLRGHRYAKHPDFSTQFHLRPAAPAALLPKAGIKVTRQAYQSNGLPIVFSEISGKEQVSVFIPQKSEEEVLVKKGSIELTDGSHGVKVLSVNQKNEIQEVYVKVDEYARRHIRDVGENHNPEKSMNHSFANSVWGFASDIPGAMGSVQSIQSVANLQISGDLGVTGFRMASAGGLLTGVVSYLKAANEMESASRINDVAGKQFALIRYIRSGLEFAGGALAAGVRVLSLLPPQAAKVSSVALSVLGKVWNVTGIGSSLLLFIPMIKKARKASKWMEELKEKIGAETTEQTKAAGGLKFLMGKLELSAEEKVEVCNKTFARPLYSLVHEEVMLNQDEEDILHDKDRKEIAQKIDLCMSNINPAEHPLISDWDQVRLNLSVRLMKEWAHHKMVLEAEYGRMIGGGSLEILKKEMKGETDLSRGLYYDVNALREVNALLKMVENNVEWNFKITCFVTVSCVLGIFGTIASMVFSAGTAPFIVGVVCSVLSNIIGTLLDMQSFKEDVSGVKNSSYKERYMIYLFSLLTIVSGVLGGVFYQDAITLAIVVVGTICMLGLNAYALKLSFEKEREAKEFEEKRIHDERARRVLEKQRISAKPSLSFVF